MRAITIIAALSLLLVAATYNPYGTMTPYCYDDTWRYYQADKVFIGTVRDVTEARNELSTEIRFRVEESLLGSARLMFRITQPGRLDKGPVVPGMTLDWPIGSTWRIQAREQRDGTYALVCGELGRSPVTSKDCPPGTVHAKSEATGQCTLFPDRCSIPEGYYEVISCEDKGLPHMPGCETVVLAEGSVVYVCTPGTGVPVKPTPPSYIPPTTQPAYIPPTTTTTEPPEPPRLATPRPFAVVKTFLGVWR